MSEIDFSKLEEGKIIELAQKGDGAAFDYLIYKYKETAKMVSRKYYIIGADADDVLQEGMIGIFKGIRDYKVDGGAAFSSFIQTCVERQIQTAVTSANREKHQALNTSIRIEAVAKGGEGENRGRKRNDSEALGPKNDMNRDPGEIAVQREGLDDLVSAADETLTELEKLVWIRALEGKNYREIAAELEKPAKTIDNAMQRAKKKMRNRLSIVDILPE